MDVNDLLEPELLYKRELKAKHHENVVSYLKDLTEKGKVDKVANKATCEKLYNEEENLKKLQKKMKGLKFLKVLFIILCVILVGIFLLIFVYKPKRKALDAKIVEQEELIKSLRDTAYAQMAGLNSLFEASIPSKIMQKTTPLIEMDRIFDVKKYEMLREKYGLWDNSDENDSTLDIQSGSILGNPFVIFKDLHKETVMHRYEGRLTITYSVGSGQNRRTVSQVLTAYVEKPKPEYSRETYLVYGNEAADHLSFSRNPSEINNLDEKGIAKYVKHHEKDLEKLAEKAMKKGGTYTPLGNTEFELFFGGLDRDNEVEYRLLFTPLGQKSMLQVLKSKEGYGDDFSFTKVKGLNLIQSAHSQGTALFVNADELRGFDYEKVEKNFIEYNDNYFKALFFDFAPLLCIPLYQQHKAHEYIYKNNVGSNINCFEHEVVANHFNLDLFRPLKAKTDVILKTKALQSVGDSDIVNVTSHSFDTVKHIEYVSKLGGDGRFHSVPVEWIEYVPVSAENVITVSDLGVDDEVKFNTLGQKQVIYAKGLVGNDKEINVDIKSLKSQMNKD